MWRLSWTDFGKAGKRLKGNVKFSRLAAVLAAAGILVALVFLVFSQRLEGTAPVAAIDPPFGAVGREHVFAIQAHDAGSGLRQVRLSVSGQGRDVVLVDRIYPGGGGFGGGERTPQAIEVRLVPTDHGFAQGQMVLRLEVRDNAWRRWGRGNRTVLERPVRVDTQPPVVTVLSPAHNINQGGSGLVLYRVSEPCRRSGVTVGDVFYPGQPGLFEDRLMLAAFVALRYDQGPGTPMALVAEDEAGNAVQRALVHHIRPRQWRQDVLEIGDGFLESKMPELAALLPAPAPESPLEQYLAVNRGVRRENYARLQEIVGRSDDRRHWADTFVRLPRAANRAMFADHRVYRYKGAEIDRQIHMGVDLASLANSPVPAANTGRVAFAGDLGIYGLTVVLDHGLGLFSMYSHLSRIDVGTEAMVARGDVLGLTGITGLAGGDHLHFSILVRDTFVNPIEWWDDQWIRHNITDRIEALAK
jgi:murein DD-endopeptidase MepM/ murein hydrolase activator NlpD